MHCHEPVSQVSCQALRRNARLVLQAQCLDGIRVYLLTLPSCINTVHWVMQCAVCNAGPLELQEVIAIALDVLEGLTQLHALHILHLDLKPGNVLLDDHGHAYLSDFGISHALRTLEACTAVTSSSGTPHYM